MTKLRDILTLTGVLFVVAFITYSVIWLFAMVGCLRFINPGVIFYGKHWTLVVLRIFLILGFLIVEIFGVLNILVEDV